MAKYDNYKFRASSVGQIMTNPKAKKDKLAKGAQAYLRKLFITEEYGRTMDIENKYTEKGIMVEDESIDIASRVLGIDMIKNETPFTSDYLTGTPDVNEPLLLDIKSSWNIFSFYEANGENKLYMWQLQSYMALTGAKEATLCYVLTNTPIHLIVAEKTRQMYRHGYSPEDKENILQEMQIEQNMEFDDIPEEKRVKVFKFKRDNKAIEAMYEKIENAREYLNSLTF